MTDSLAPSKRLSYFRRAAMQPTLVRGNPTARVFIACTCVVLTSGCFPEVFVDSEELDAIATVRESGHDFSDYKTYALDPELQVLANLVEDPRDIPDWVEPVVLNTIAEEMAAQGYERVPYDETDPAADVTLIAGAVSSDNWVLTGYYPWWPGYWYYYPVTVPVNYPSGSLIITMLRPQDSEADEDDRNLVPAVWAAGLRGLVTGSQSSGTRRITSGVAQAFDQSPYLKTGGPVDPVYDGGTAPEVDAGAAMPDAATATDGGQQ